MTRRTWLGTALAVGGGLGLGRATSGADGADGEVAQIEQRARKVGLGPFRSSVNEPYLGIGDAPDPYRAKALELCRSLSTAYQKYFRDKGFKVEIPSRRLSVVTLKDQKSYAAFLGEEPGESVGGHYDPETNRLVVFDFRGDPESGVAPERINTFTLIHEATHQLTYNTGMLDRLGDVPVSLSEGLAMYAELWRPGDRSVIGAVNTPRLKVLVDQAKQGGQAEDWIPVDKLLTDDALFQDAASSQLAYAVAWVFVHHLIRTTAMLPKFRSYLDAIRPRRDSTQRLADAKAHFGDLDRLNRELRKHAMRLIQELRARGVIE